MLQALLLLSFVIVMGLEWHVGRTRGRQVFRVPDATSNLLLGMAQLAPAVVLFGFLQVTYEFIYDRSAALKIVKMSPIAWIGLLIGVDFCYYWFHRFSHRVHVAWTSHALHHQGEDYNLALGIRQHPTQGFFERAFYLPLAFIGFPPRQAAIAVTINAAYQLFLHTELVGKLGPLEWVLNTPSHHRVHHGINPQYLDKNFGGMLIIWDRMFGTFAEEHEPPVYGAVEQVASFDPVHCMWAPLDDVIERASRTSDSMDELGVWIMPPGWRPKSMAKADTQVRLDRPKYDVKLNRESALYLMAMTGLTIAMMMWFLFINDLNTRPLRMQLAFIAWVAVTVVGLGGLIEGRAWAKPVEALRLVATPFIVMTLV
ncbi:sterol desaturase family protein [Polyangium sp. 6x1]|uniref:sterol desaturase family protein n=1 Tax=Polyangium sp. 6x1 TaxID=3042689 RepID=UPI002483218A|nr:sterol desaturase family protein [Polyangium sp. 6x1]MDI1450150.1 sterol desaturase family protein [Polyangium sp. 6x1]